MWGQLQEGELIDHPFATPGWQRGQQTLGLLPLSLAKHLGKSWELPVPEPAAFFYLAIFGFCI